MSKTYAVIVTLVIIKNLISSRIQQARVLLIVRVEILLSY